MNELVASLAAELGARLVPPALQDFSQRVPPNFATLQRPKQLEIFVEYIVALDFKVAGAPALPANMKARLTTDAAPVQPQWVPTRHPAATPLWGR